MGGSRRARAVTPEEALADCAALVRRFDPDRYFTGLFAPAQKRPLLYALYAFNHEIAHAVEATREPMMAEIRLEWWREAIMGAREGQPRVHPVAIGLAELFARSPILPEPFEALIDARAAEISTAPFADLEALEAHAGATSGALMSIAARLLAPQADAEALAREAGTAYGLAGILRAISFQAARGKVFLPNDLLAAEGLTPADALAARDPAGLTSVIADVAYSARSHFVRARSSRIPREVAAAILPAALVPAYIASLRHVSGPLREQGDLSQFRRQIILARAALLGRL